MLGDDPGMPLNHGTTYLQLTDRQFELLGRAVVEWANIEKLLGWLLVRLLLTPEFLGRTYTDRMSAARVDEAIREALEMHSQRYGSRIVSEGEQARVRQLLAEIARMRGLRNQIAHFCWSRFTDDEIFGTPFSGGHPRLNHPKSGVVLNTTDLERAHAEFSAAVDALTAIVEAIPKIDEGEAIILAEANKASKPTPPRRPAPSTGER